MSLSINLWNSWPLWHGPGPRAGPISILSYGKFKFYNISICTSVLSSLGTKVKCVLLYPKCPLQIHVIMSFIFFLGGGGCKYGPIMHLFVTWSHSGSYCRWSCITRRQFYFRLCSYGRHGLWASCLIINNKKLIFFFIQVFYILFLYTQFSFNKVSVLAIKR